MHIEHQRIYTGYLQQHYIYYNRNHVNQRRLPLKNIYNYEVVYVTIGNASHVGNQSELEK